MRALKKVQEFYEGRDRGVELGAMTTSHLR